MHTGSQPQLPNHVYLLYPNPAKTNLFIGKVNMLAGNFYKDVRYAVDYEITTDLLRRAMGENQETRGNATSYVQGEMLQQMTEQITAWLERYEKTEETILLNGPPFMLNYLMNKLQKNGASFDFSERERLVLAAAGRSMKMPASRTRTSENKWRMC